MIDSELSRRTDAETDRGDAEPHSQNEGATGPSEVRVAYVTPEPYRKWALHADRACPLLQGRDREGQPVAPDVFFHLGWCAVCSPWLEAAKPSKI